MQPVPSIDEDDDGEIYQREFGAHKPVFEGKLPGYEAIGCGSIIIITCCTLMVWLFNCILILILLYISTTYSVQTEVGGGAIICVAFVLFLIVGVYFGAPERIVKEKEMYEKKLKEMGFIERGIQHQLQDEEEEKMDEEPEGFDDGEKPLKENGEFEIGS